MTAHDEMLAVDSVHKTKAAKIPAQVEKGPPLALNDCFGEEESVFFKDVATKRAIHAPVENPTPMHIYTAAVKGLCALLAAARESTHSWEGKWEVTGR